MEMTQPVWTPESRKELDAVLKSLQLQAMCSTLDQTAELARKECLTHEAFLLELARLEHQERTVRRTQRLLKESRLPLEKTLGSFDRKRLPLRVDQRLSSLLDGSFLERRENVLAFGNPGSGKTHLLCAIARELVERQGRRLLFTKCALLVQELLAAKKALTLARTIRRLAGYDALIIDDIGYVQQGRDEMEVLFTLLAERYERGSVMLSSNLPFSKWELIFKDAMTAAAAVDRLVHHSVILELNITSYRMQQAQKKGGGK